MRISFRTVALVVALFVFRAEGALQEASPDSEPAAITGAAGNAPGGTASFWKKLQLEGLIGPSFLKGETGLALAARGRAGRWLLEWGGILPHDVRDYADHASDELINGYQVTKSGRVESFGEMHWMLSYPLVHWEKTRPATIYGGAGPSLAFIRNRVDTVTYDALGNLQDTRTEAGNRARIGPRVQLGLVSAFTRHIALSVNLAWVYYPNEEVSVSTPLDLDFGGLLVEPMLHWRF